MVSVILALRTSKNMYKNLKNFNTRENAKQ